MEPVNFQLPGYRVNDYMIVLSPHEELRNKITRIKEEFADKYKSTSARFNRTNIALVSYAGLEMMEERIIQRLQSIAMGISPFKVELKDYGSFPSHTIFIHVISKLPVQNLVKQLKVAQRLMKLNQENKPVFIDEPFLTIARKLKPWQYEQGWLEYGHRQFTGRFIADHMLLLKRQPGQRSAYQIVKSFDFMNLPVTTRQGELFG